MTAGSRSTEGHRHASLHVFCIEDCRKALFVVATMAGDLLGALLL